MKKSIKVVLDSDFLIALFLGDQPNHYKAQQIFESIKSGQLYVINLVHYELATVISYKFSHHLAVQVLNDMNNLPIKFVEIDRSMEDDIWSEFFQHKKKRVSFVDCANLVIAQKGKMKIASFDKFYPKEILISV